MLKAYELVITDFSKPVLQMANVQLTRTFSGGAYYIDKTGKQYIDGAYICTGLIYHINDNIWYIGDSSLGWEYYQKDALRKLKRYHRKLLAIEINRLRKIKSFL